MNKISKCFIRGYVFNTRTKNDVQIYSTDLEIFIDTLLIHNRKTYCL